MKVLEEEDTGTAIFIAHAQPVDSDSEADSNSFRKPVLIADASEILPLYRQKRFWCAVTLVLCSIGLAVCLTLELAAPKSKEATAPSDELSSNPTQPPYPSIEPSDAPSPGPSAPPTISDSPSLSPTSSPTSYEDTRMNALIMLYEATNGMSWNKNDLWGSSSVSVCAWYGVRCNNDGRIIDINLGSNNLQGMRFKEYII